MIKVIGILFLTIAISLWRIGNVSNEIITYSNDCFDSHIDVSPNVVSESNSSYQCPPEPINIARVNNYNLPTRTFTQHKRIFTAVFKPNYSITSHGFRASCRTLKSLFPANRTSDLYIIRFRRILI